MEESRGAAPATAAAAGAVAVPEAAGALESSAGGPDGSGGRGDAGGSGGGGGAGGAGGRSRSALGSVALVLSGGVSVQFGAALAVLLMPRAGVLGIVSLRLALAAVVLLLACRPTLRGYRRSDWGTILVFGAVMAAMNCLFYEAVDRIPLGAGVTLEVLGPLVLSVVASRKAVSVVWAVCALGGVTLLSGGGFDRLDPLGTVFGLGAGAMWATYILFSARTGRRFPQADGLALAMAVGAVLALPLGIVDAGSKMLVPSTIGLTLGVAVMSSVLPYTFELLALRSLPASTFSVLMSLEPAIAAVAGVIVLHQVLSLVDAVAITLVVVASMGAIATQIGIRSWRREARRSARGESGG